MMQNLPEINEQELMQQQQQQLMEQQNQPNNPFDNYDNVGVPDQPLQYGGSMVDHLLNDNEVPEEIRTKYWEVFHKDNTLSFLDEERKKSKMLSFDILKIDLLNTIPYNDYSFGTELEFNKVRGMFEGKLDRSMGIKGANVKNERIMLQSQFTENKQISENNQQSQIKEGFIKRLLTRN